MSRVNPFDAIYAQINSMSADEKMANLPDFPKALDVELTNTCNFKCLMCPVGTRVQKRKPGFMSEEVYNRVLAEAAAHGTPLRFILWGEPTMHTNWISYLKRAKDKGLIVHFNTNGSLLDTEQMQQLVDLGVDSIKFSFQGVDTKSYREMRNIDYYEKLLDKVEELYTVRGDKAAPYIHVSTTITYETTDQIKTFQKRVGKITDKVTIGRTELGRFDVSSAKLSNAEKQTLEMLKENESLVKKHPSCCPEVYDKLSVHWDGVVSACCRDFNDVMVVGNVQETPLAEIWKSEKLLSFRKELAKGNFDKFPLCKICFDYQSLQTPGLQGIK